MGRRGPPPKPNAQRTATHAARALEAPPARPDAVDPPPEDPNWHPEAKVWFLSLAGTPQSAAYTYSDWGHAHAAAAILSAALLAGDLRTALGVLDSAGRRLMTTRDTRLSAHLDVDDAPTAEPAAPRPGEIIDLPTTEELRARVFGGAA